MHKKPRSIQQQGLLRQWQTDRACVQLSGESAGLLESELDTKTPTSSAESQWGVRLLCYDLRTSPSI